MGRFGWLVVGSVMVTGGCGSEQPETARDVVGVVGEASALGGEGDLLFDDAPGLRWQGPEALAPPGLAFVESLEEYAPQFLPSDTRFRDQWALSAIDAPKAWDTVRNARRVVVAVIDSGVVLEHPDLAGAIWTNEGEVPDNGLDDDENGYVDDVHGWDFLDGDGDPSAEGTGAGAFHGTHVAGIIGATFDDHRGITGVAPGVRIMALRVLSNRTGRSDTIADAIDYATDNGANVVNLSLGGSPSRLIDEALARAWSKGVLIAAASGNEGRSRVSFPAASSVPGVIGVGAFDTAGRLASFSNRGPEVDIVAPGVDILSTFGARSYELLSGTSMATPHVAGAAALLLAMPGMTPAKALARLLQGPAALSLAALVDGPATAHPPDLRALRTKLTFRCAVASRRPPPQTVKLEAAHTVAVSIEAPRSLTVSGCPRVPCRLTVSVDPSQLGFGAHSLVIRVVPEAGDALVLGVEVDVGELSDAALELKAIPAGQPGADGVVAFDAGTVLELRPEVSGRLAAATLELDGRLVRGRRLRGMFRAHTRHVLVARDGDGRQASFTFDVTGGDAPHAATGLDIP